MIALTYNGTAATAADGLAAGYHGIAVNPYTYAFALGTLTLTINSANLLGTSGTVTYVAQETTLDSTKVKWWEPSTGDTALKIAGTSTANPDGSTTQGPAFTISYTAAVTNATLALSNLTTAGTIFAGGSLAASGSLTASGAAATNAKLSLAQVAGVTVTGSPATSGSLGIGTPLSLAATVGSGTPGSYALAYTGTSDNNATAVAGTLNLTVLEHASGSLSAADIGNVLGGAAVTVQTTLANAGADNGVTRGNLQVMSGGAGASGLLTLTSGPAADTQLVAGGSTTTLTAVVNTSAASYAPGAFTVNVADNQSIAGASTATVLSQTVTGTIGWASATSTTSFGAPLTATVNGSAGSLASPLFSQVHNSPGAAGTTASLLGSTTVNGPVTMAWRQATVAEISHPGAPLISDVMDLGGMSAASAYVLEMTFDPNNFAVKGNMAALAAAGRIYLASDTSGNWRNAVLDNTGAAGSNLRLDFQGSYQQYLTAVGGSPILGSQVGSWGVDTTNDTVWAVLNHASNFAVVPEPATMAFLLLGGIAMTTTALARRRNAKK
jgi:hypothetical protein